MSIQSYTKTLTLDIERPRFCVMLSIHMYVLDSVLPPLPLLLENGGNGGNMHFLLIGSGCRELKLMVLSSQMRKTKWNAATYDLHITWMICGAIREKYYILCRSSFASSLGDRRERKKRMPSATGCRQREGSPSVYS